jgi:5-methylcytosine-specific restriction endonuclease McrA
MEESICPKWDKCNKFKCHDEQVCLNAEYWAKYWGSTERASLMASIPKPQKAPKRYKENWKGICHYCERKLVGRLFSTRDHLIPIGQGGSNDPRNSVESCQRCNSLKGNRTPDQFAIELGYWITECKHGISRDSLIIILVNTRKLILEIAPYRHELYKKSAPCVPRLPIDKDPEVIPKKYPKKLPEATKLQIVDKSDRWWHEVYLPGCHGNPEIFQEK